MPPSIQDARPQTPPRRRPQQQASHQPQVNAPQVIPERPFLRVQALIDCLDTVHKWHQAEVTAVDLPGRRVHVHYIYYGGRYDEWIPADSDRLAQHGTRCYVGGPGSALRRGQLIDVFDEHGPLRKWAEGRVIEEEAHRVKVRFKAAAASDAVAAGAAAAAEGGRAEIVEEWLPRTSVRIAPFGQHSRKRVPYKPASDVYWQQRGHTQYIGAARQQQRGGPLQAARQQQPQAQAAASAAADGAGAGAAVGVPPGGGDATTTTSTDGDDQQGGVDARVLHYLTSLTAQGMQVVPMGGDGNCLFRSVAHQVYGDQERHDVTRAAAAAYMAAEASWFSSFVVGDRSDFEGYIAAIARPGVWGDDPEIQALCEIYDRPAEIWAYDPSCGARKLRTFHSARSSSRPPIRLSYYGGGHYDSVVGPGWQAALLTSQPGAVETVEIERARARNAPGALVEAVRSTDAAATDAAALTSVLAQSREEYDAADASLDVAMLMSLGIDPWAAQQQQQQPQAQEGAGAAGTSSAAAAEAGAAAASSVSSSSAGLGVANESSSCAGVSSAAPPPPQAAAASSSTSLPPVPQATLEADIVRQTMAASAAEAEAAQAALLERLRAQHEEEQLRAALQASVSQPGFGGSGSSGNRDMGRDRMNTESGLEDEDEALQRALAMSVGAAHGVGAQSQGASSSCAPSDADRLYDMALGMTEEAQIALLMQQSAAGR